MKTDDDNEMAQCRQAAARLELAPEIGGLTQRQCESVSETVLSKCTAGNRWQLVASKSRHPKDQQNDGAANPQKIATGKSCPNRSFGSNTQMQRRLKSNTSFLFSRTTHPSTRPTDQKCHPCLCFLEPNVTSFKNFHNSF